MNLKYALRSEDTEQIAVISWAQWNMQRYPELELLHHVPNGGSRNKAEAVKLKQMGVKAGVPDLHLPVPKAEYCGLYIEMKYGSGRIQDTQKEFMRAAAAVKVLEDYLKLKPINTGLGENIPRVPNLSIVKEGKVKEL